MLLQSRAGEFPHSVVGATACIPHRTRNVLDIVVNLPLIGRRRDLVGANQIDQGLDALNKKGGLIFEIILQPCKTCFASMCAWGMLVYLKFGHALIPLVAHPIRAVALSVIAAVRGAVRTISGRLAATAFAALTLMAKPKTQTVSVCSIG